MGDVMTFDAIGTRWRIECPGNAVTDMVEHVIHETIDRFDQSFSRFRKDSWVNTVCLRPGTYHLPGDAYELLVLYRSLYDATDGHVTPLIGRAMEQAGYDADYSLVPTTVKNVPAFDEVVSFDRHSITTTAPVLLDFGAAGKGYLVDTIGAVLHESGIRDFVIDAGGDILRSASDDSMNTIGLEDPEDTAKAIGTCGLTRGSLCASAGSRRKWDKFTHIIDPVTLTSPRSILGTWVRAETAAVADALATALFFVPPQKLTDRFTFSYAILDDTRTMTASRNFGLQTFAEAGL